MSGLILRIIFQIVITCNQTGDKQLVRYLNLRPVQWKVRNVSPSGRNNLKLGKDNNTRLNYATDRGTFPIFIWNFKDASSLKVQRLPRLLHVEMSKGIPFVTKFAYS